MKNIFVTGASGYIGKALVKAGAFPILSLVTDKDELEKEVQGYKPDVILHLAAKSDPDFCEDEKNRECVIETNVGGTTNIMLVAEKLNIPCVLFSSGQVWKGGFWERAHRENDAINGPVNMYGISKWGAEVAAGTFGNSKIIRLSTVFDYPRLEKKLETIQKGFHLYEPTFIRRSFIYLPDMVGLLMEYCERISEMPKILHLAGSETVGWYDFMYDVAREYGLPTHLIESRRHKHDGHAPRPGNAGLDTSLARSLGFRIPSYRDGIKRMKNEI